MFLALPEIQVEMVDGTKKPIGELRLGDVVRGLYGNNTVLGVRRKKLTSEELYNVQGITVSASQLFRTARGWAAADAEFGQYKYPRLSVRGLVVGDSLGTRTGQTAVLNNAVVRVNPTQDMILVEIELDNDHTFYVNDYLVHNFGGGGSTTQVTKTDPPAYLQPYLTEVAQKASRAYSRVPQTGFSGQLVAAPTTAQTQAIQQQKDIAAGLSGSGFGSTAANLADTQANKVLSGAYTAPASNVYQGANINTDALIESALQPLLRNLQTNVIPQVQSQAIAQGAYGSDRADLTLAGNIYDQFTKPAADLSAQLAYGEAVRQDTQGFENFIANQQLFPELFKIEQAAALTSPELANYGVQQQLLPSQLLAGAGQQEQLFNQDALDEAYQQYILSTQTPFAGLDQYAGILGGIPFGGVSTATGARQSASNPIAGALGGGLTAYGLSSAFPSALGFLGGAPGLIGGALLGGLLGA